MSDQALPKSDRLRPVTGNEIRSAFLNFFASRNHKVISSASLIPEDPTVLLTIAGMLPFKPVFLGKEDPPAPRATTSQKCIRTNDIENVGKTARHHTFFEMLGNFSFGDYFKHEAIKWAWELITQVFCLDPKHLVISVFRDDDETEKIWREIIGVNKERIIRLDEADNFWSSGVTGPCGPCSEIYYDFNPELGDQDLNLEDGNRFIEFYNLVFMQYNRDAEGNLIPLANCNIDTGMGLERMAQILQNTSNNYETDLIFPLIEKTAVLAGIEYSKVGDKNQTSLKIIADHSRAVTQLISDGVSASNLGRGYVLRRLLRRMIRHGRLLGIDDPFLPKLGSSSIDLMKDAYPELEKRRDIIISELQMEETRFLETLERGEKLLANIIANGPEVISGLQAFELYDTYGFPLELTQEVAEENNLTVDLGGFEHEMQKQRKRAKAAAVSIDLTLKRGIEKVFSDIKETSFNGFEHLTCSGSVLAILIDGEPVERASEADQVTILLDKTPFFAESGGQVGDQGILQTEEIVVAIDGVTKEKNFFLHSGRIERGTLKINDIVTAKVDKTSRYRAMTNHTATHLLQSALKSVLDPSVSQKGSLVAFDRLRFDFNAHEPLSQSNLKEVENMINNWILESHPIVIETMEKAKALAAGALAMFGEKYGDLVRVVDVPGVSKELCGGTHVTNTSELGVFKIIDEAGVASGIRRIEAVSGPSVLDYLNARDSLVRKLTDHFKAQPHEIIERVFSLQNDIKVITKQLSFVKNELALAKVLSLANESTIIGNSQYIVKRLDGVEGSSLQVACQNLINQLGGSTAVVIGGIPDLSIDNKVILVAAFGSELITKGLNAGKFVDSIAKLCGGGGGGRANIAQAGGRDTKSLDSALDHAGKELIRFLS